MQGQRRENMTVGEEDGLEDARSDTGELRDDGDLLHQIDGDSGQERRWSRLGVEKARRSGGSQRERAQGGDATRCWTRRSWRGRQRGTDPRMAAMSCARSGEDEVGDEEEARICGQHRWRLSWGRDGGAGPRRIKLRTRPSAMGIDEHMWIWLGDDQNEWIRPGSKDEGAPVSPLPALKTAC